MPLRIVQPVSAEMPDPPENLLLTIWKMFLQPVLKQRRNSPWQADNCVTGELRACFRACIQDLRNLVISEPGNDWRNHYSNWDFCRTKLCYGVEPTLRRARARFEHSLQDRIERCH